MKRTRNLETENKVGNSEQEANAGRRIKKPKTSKREIAGGEWRPTKDKKIHQIKSKIWDKKADPLKVLKQRYKK